MKWFRWDYKQGLNRPYHIWLHNYYKHECGAVSESVSEDVSGKSVLNPCEITPYIGEQDADVPVSVSENDESVCANNQERLSSTGTTMKGSPDDPAKKEAADLLNFIWNQCRMTRPKKWAENIVKTYPLLEIEYAIAEFLYGSTDNRSPRAITFFFRENSVVSVIAARRSRCGDANQPCLKKPFGWHEAVEHTTDDSTDDSAEAAD